MESRRPKPLKLESCHLSPFTTSHSREMREHLGIGQLLKDDKITDHRSKVAQAMVASD